MLPEDTIHKKAVVEFLTGLYPPPSKSLKTSIKRAFLDEIIGCFQEHFDYWPEELTFDEGGSIRAGDDRVFENRTGKFRRDGAETSKEAAHEVALRSGTQRFRVLEAVVLYGSTGATRDQISNYLKMTPNSVRPRVKELLEGGFLRPQQAPTGGNAYRSSNSNRPSIVLEATPKGIAAWDKEKTR